jgi:hypothetical protein
MRTLVLLTVASVLAWAVPSEAQEQRCTSTYNELFKQYETRCSDGSRGTETYNPLFRQWESTTTSGPGAPSQATQRCTKTYNQLFKQWETVCR